MTKSKHKSEQKTSTSKSDKSVGKQREESCEKTDISDERFSEILARLEREAYVDGADGIRRRSMVAR